MVTINIGRKEMVFFSVVFLVFAVVGFGVAQWDGTKTMFHSADEVKVEKSDGSFVSLQELVSDGNSAGEVRVWQNMGPKHSADSQDHLSFCDAGYLMSGLRVFAAAALDGFVTAHCTKSSMTLSGSTIKGPTGNIDGAFHNLNCDNNQVISSVTFYSGTYFDDITLECKNLVGATLDNSNTVWALNLYGGPNNELYDSELNGVYDSETIIADCPSGYVATGIRAYAVSYLENFDLLCKKII